ncbi:hypothetical protein ACFSC6_16485 [Rufibacter sediminis]|uniref:Uncharacterized protein n=1 Tax=Rufibacter sediminis TaxID=2762756 RepID=A0ABR6VMJ3_9BACT|nr:hypothetical protein [Rufibacter sediminis]MBC3538415.1 hypothetical protein [Rufibacter sediminis]
MLNLVLRIAKHHLKYPLMWVVLLWAVTLPGQEAEVYRFLFFGRSAQNALETAPGSADRERSQVKQEGVHAFPDAKASSSPELKFPPALKPTSPELSFALLAGLAPDLHDGISFVSLFLSRLLPSSLQPNAP